ncbi:PEP-utilizing protein mobile region [Desulfovibrio sp. X2]|uniref:PEP-utilizing enzyme n=1 Tax=Desulfovibrio sp. X2 TaxID=941449 RepID=UPI000358BFAA|nr:PEP-utilizing enzyme [Desulfovibrio sp. X2]EPR44269.1 PEP-utilizing protein mobile region [Desulfovibrio sp. X2]
MRSTSRPSSGRTPGQPGTPSGSPGAPHGAEALRALFAKFRRILELNNRVLEMMAEMERALGGEYIFDSAFLRSAVAEMSGHVHQVAYCLNVLSGNRHVALYDRYEAIRNILDDLLEGGPGPGLAGGRQLVLPGAEVRWEVEPLVGQAAAALAETARAGEIGLLDCFFVSAAGIAAWREAGGSPDELPPALAEAVREELANLFRRLGGPRRLVLEALPHAAAEATPRAQARGAGPDADEVLRAVAALLAEADAVSKKVAAAGGDENEAAAASPACVRLREDLAARAAGSILAMPREAELPGTMLVTARCEAMGPGEDRYFLRRVPPHELVRSEQAAAADLGGKNGGPACAPGKDAALAPGARGLRRGSAILAPGALTGLASAARTLENALGGPPALTWAMDQGGRLLALDVSVCTPPPESVRVAGLDRILAGAERILSGGATVQSGVAAGRVVHVDEHTDPSALPPGAVLVARAAAPSLSPLLRRAAAVVTEMGSATGHLATIARECRLPAVFGLQDARARLPEDTEVTVDAGAGVVYRGVIEPLLDFQASAPEFGPTDPEYLTLRRLLRFIRPLSISHPSDEGFAAANCRTFHDIIHFCHEQAMEELLELSARHPDLEQAATRPLELPVPLDLFVLDLGGGVAPEAGQRLGPEDLTSRPLRALLRGLASPSAWDNAPMALHLGDVFAGLGRSTAALDAPGQGYSGRNLAVAARTYCNVSLRMGYHFNVIDSWLGDTPGQNYVYYRFVGGFADEARRGRRAELVRRALSRLGFRVEVRGDLVTARLRMGEREEIELTLSRLGELTGFTRQLDLAMGSEEDVAALEARFAEIGADNGNGNGTDSGVGPKTGDEEQSTPTPDGGGDA